ncbi:ribonuclease R [Weissella halotolerans]|uniref:Ribonuclease R n=1 Tax=Weissella halotolerans DSM 20190 TaxID=1123500 RepID=A0A0R2FQS0_9LACO|nr:ribonuclease R [Weissella halotolerans]KRN30851.1 exoribonuclease R [Weissella halotolerans DSM 20190]
MTEVKTHTSLENQLFGFLKANPGQAFSAQSLADGLHASDSNIFTKVVQALASLERAEKVKVNDQGAFAYNPDKEGVIGDFHANDRGFGFVHYAEDGDDIFINPDNTKLALQGDQVRVKLLSKGDGQGAKGPEGQVVEIMHHAREQVVGVFTLGSPYAGYIGSIKLTDKKFSTYEFLVKEGGVKATDGEIVVATIDDYPTVSTPKRMTGTITKTIGYKDEPGVDILQIVYNHDVPHVFPKDVLDQAEKIPAEVQASERIGREDITDQPLVTIDSIESKDLDDAVVVWRLPNGNFHLGVHIADVSHYVPEGTPLDEEAYNRGTSVYLTDRVIPMLPRNISNGIASLNPGVERLAMSAEMEFTPEGELVNHRIHQSVMKSHARMTYKAVNAILAGDETTRNEYQDLVPMFEDMAQLHHALVARRQERGAIEFDAPEAKIIVDDDGKPTDIELRERGESERMIESFMLAANETVAMHYDLAKVPFLYRIHEAPESDRVQQFADFVKALGCPVKLNPDNVKPKDLQQVHQYFVGRPEEQMVSTMMLRAMQQAKYSDQPLGHFGIGADYYTHFTSPIRRYPDLTVHRLIKWYAENGMDEAAQSKYRDRLAQTGEDTSVKERRAVDTERDTDAMKKAEFMEDKVGQEFDAVVNGVMKFGMFVSLDNTVEGLIHTSNLNDDYYLYDEQHMALIGRRFHHIYQVGQPVRVKLIRVDKEQSALDFVLVNPEAAPKTDIQVADPHHGAFGKGNGKSQGAKNGRGYQGKRKSAGKPSDHKAPKQAAKTQQRVRPAGRHK